VERAAFDALARTLHLDEVVLGATQTIGRGTLAAPRDSAPPPSGQTDLRATLPKLDVAPVEGGVDGASSRRDFVLTSRLGEGGMGLVWLARQVSLEREVAIKHLKPELRSPNTAATLLVEARATGALEHPCIVPVHALGVDDEGSPLLVMKRVEGASLATLLNADEHPSWADLEARYGDRLGAMLAVLGHVADALEFAHVRGFVHRDVKPENVMVGAFGEVYLLDWGLALKRDRLSEEERRSLSIVGTPGFMAPEMVSGRVEEVDARTDVYLLGATLHAMLTKRPRHEGANLRQVLIAAATSEPYAYDARVPAELAALCNRATDPDPEKRPRSAAAFREALVEFGRHRGSMRLAHEARDRLGGLRGRTSRAEGDGPRMSQDPDVAAALVECRFAFTQALREWPANPVAKEGLRETLLAMIEAELARKSPEAAFELARQLDPPEPAIVARIDALREKVAESQRLEDEARREVHERDRSVGARLGVFIQSGLIVAILAAGVLGTMQAPGPRASAVGIFGWSVGLLGLSVATLLAFRERALANRWGRQMSALLVVVLGAAATSSGMVVLHDGDVAEATAHVMGALAAVLAGGAIALDGRLWWSSGASLLAAGACTFAPAWTPLAASLAGVVAVAVFLPESIRNARAQAGATGA
jgi:serine/threonine-protein kinase